jgi:hypothetical protein
MGSLANFLVENILNEEVNPITALFGGGFKPPTAGHLEVVKKAINDNPEIDKVIIYVGGKVRNGVTQDQAIKIWDKFYKPQINKPVEILPSVAPVKDIYRYAKNNPEETVYWVIGAREGREDDLKDIASRSISIDKYPNLQLKTTSTPDGGMSGTNARKAIVNNNFEEFERYLPDNVDKNAIWNILTKQELNESHVTIDMGKVNKALRKGMGREKETDENIISILDAHPSGNVPHPVFLDHYAKFDKYFGEKDDNRILDEIGLEHLLVNVLKLSSEDIVIVMNDYQKGNKDLEDIKWFEKYDNIHQKDEEWNPVGGGKFDDSKDNLKSVNKYLAKNKKLHEADPKKGTGKKPKGSGRRLYTDEDPSDTVKVKFSSKQDIVDTLNKKSFKSKSHARQSQVINLIHQRVRAAYNRAKDPDVKRRLKTALDYAEERKEASKKKTQRLKKENIDPKAQAKHKGKSAPFGSAYKPVKEKSGFGGSERYRAIEKRNNKYYFIHDNPFAPGVRQEFGPYKTKAAALRKMGTFPPASNYRDLTEKDINETGLKIAKKNMDDYKRSNNPSGKKPKDPFGLNQFARELMKEEDSFDTFDYPKHLKLYTQYMLDQGMDIRPLPKVKFVTNDVENAKEFLGKTAYYDPANRLIVLYTLNRHPKDVMRSFSHEMIHHLQNNQNRLGSVVTTNTNQDDHVDNLEKEANLLGTMTFRHWTDTLTEGILKERISDTRLIQGGAYPNPPTTLYHGSGYKIDLSSLSFSRTGELKGLGGFGSSSARCVGLYTFAKRPKFNPVRAEGIIFVQNFPSASPRKYAKGTWRRKKTERAYVYEIKLDKKIMILDKPAPPCFDAKDLDKYVHDTKIKYKEFDGIGHDTWEMILWDKKHIKSMTPILVGVPNPLSPDKSYESKRQLRAWEALDKKFNLTGAWKDLFWFESEEKANFFEANKDKWIQYIVDKYDPYGKGEQNLSNPLTEGVLKEGRYDKISNKISSDIFNFWKKDFEAGKEASRYFENEENEDLEIDIDANITFLPNSEQLTIDGGAEESTEGSETAYLEIRFEVDPEMLPEFWEEISMNLKDVVRHEIEHITQAGTFSAGGYKKVYKKVDGKWEETDEYEWQGKDFKDDQIFRKMIDMELLPKAEYFKLAKEVDANLQGMYFRAKKEKRPFGDIINNYLDAQDITTQEKEEILDLWRSRNKILNLPSF